MPLHSPPSWGLDKGIKIPHPKKETFYEISHRTSKLVDSYEHGNERWVSIKGGEFLD
jgi:hypothetical protein